MSFVRRPPTHLLSSRCWLGRTYVFPGGHVQSRFCATLLYLPPSSSFAASLRRTLRANECSVFRAIVARHRGRCLPDCEQLCADWLTHPHRSAVDRVGRAANSKFSPAKRNND